MYTRTMLPSSSAAGELFSSAVTFFTASAMPSAFSSVTSVTSVSSMPAAFSPATDPLMPAVLSVIVLLSSTVAASSVTAESFSFAPALPASSVSSAVTALCTSGFWTSAPSASALISVSTISGISSSLYSPTVGVWTSSCSTGWKDGLP